MSQNTISMMRASAPRLNIFEEALRLTWQELADSGESFAADFQTHRFNGTEKDRSAGVAWIGSRIMPSPEPDRVMVTNGTMNSILLLTSSLVGPGNVILMEELTFPIAYTLTRVAAAKVVGVHIDEAGMIPEDFEKKCIAFKPKAVYVNCTVHSPTAYVMPTQRREEIARIARDYNVQIMEDEAQALYLSNAPKSFATIAPDITWYMMGLSKYLSLGFRMAFIVAPSQQALESLLERFRPVTSWHVAPIIANIATHWIETGRAQQLLNAVREEVHKRQAIVAEVLADTPGYRGSDGIHFWLQAPNGVSSAQFGQALTDAGVIVRPSRLYSGVNEPRFQGIRAAVGEPMDVATTRKGVEIIRDTHRRLAAQHV